VTNPTGDGARLENECPHTLWLGGSNPPRGDPMKPTAAQLEKNLNDNLPQHIKVYNLEYD